MNISDKIEEIRQQPEHIRLRWVWGLTAGLMVVIIILWIILLKSQSIDLPKNISPDAINLPASFNQEKKSIEDAVGQLKGVVKSTPDAASNAANTGE